MLLMLLFLFSRLGKCWSLDIISRFIHKTILEGFILSMMNGPVCEYEVSFTSTQRSNLNFSNTSLVLFEEKENVEKMKKETKMRKKEDKEIKNEAKRR